MACELLDIINDTCPAVAGGILEARITPCSNVEDVTFDADGQITNITTGAGGWLKLIFDKDDTAYYNQEGERVTPRLHVTNQTAFMKFAGIDKDKVKAARELKRCCCVVAVYKMGNGKTVVQGVELIPGTTDEWQFTKRETNATVSILTDTGANEDRIEITIAGQAFEESSLSTIKLEDLDV